MLLLPIQSGSPLQSDGPGQHPSAVVLQEAGEAWQLVDVNVVLIAEVQSTGQVVESSPPGVFGELGSQIPLPHSFSVQLAVLTEVIWQVPVLKELLQVSVVQEVLSHEIAPAIQVSPAEAAWANWPENPTTQMKATNKLNEKKHFFRLCISPPFFKILWILDCTDFNLSLSKDNTILNRLFQIGSIFTISLIKSFKTPCSKGNLRFPDLKNSFNGRVPPN